MFAPLRERMLRRKANDRNEQRTFTLGELPLFPIHHGEGRETTGHRFSRWSFGRCSIGVRLAFRDVENVCWGQQKTLLTVFGGQGERGRSVRV